MPKIASQIDTLRVPVKGLIPEQSASAPASPVEGLLWHDTANKQVKIYLNGVWVRCDNNGYAVANHTHPISQVDGLTTALESKAQSSHTHATSEVTNLDSTLAAMTTDTGQRALKTTKITAGTGLTGGGDFSADRTVAVDTNIVALRSYVDGVAQGLKTRTAVRVATTANITLSGTQTIDGVALAAGNRVLVKNQTDNKLNGIYTVAAAAWTRTDQDAVDGNFWFVQEGTTNESTGWVLTTNGTITWGTSAIAFSQFSGAGSVSAGDGLQKVGNNISAISADNLWISVGPSGINLSQTAKNKIDAQKASGSWVSVPALAAGVWSATLLATTKSDRTVYRVYEQSTNDEVLLDIRRVAGGGVQLRSDVVFASAALALVAVGDPQ